MIVDQPDKALEILKGKGIMATVTGVIAMEVPDTPGGLAGVLEHLQEAEINIEYLYSFIEKPTTNAIIMIRVEKIDETLEVLKKHRVPIVTEDRVYNF